MAVVMVLFTFNASLAYGKSGASTKSPIQISDPLFSNRLGIKVAPKKRENIGQGQKNNSPSHQKIPQPLQPNSPTHQRGTSPKPSQTKNSLNQADHTQAHYQKANEGLEGGLPPRRRDGNPPPRNDNGGGGNLPPRDGNGNLPPPRDGGGLLPGGGGGGGLPPGNGGSSKRRHNKELKPEVARYKNGFAPGMEEYTNLGYCVGETTLGFAQTPKSNVTMREYHLVVTSVPNTLRPNTSRLTKNEHRDEYFMKIAMADRNGNELVKCGNLSHVEPGNSLQSKGRAINAPPLFFNEGEKARIIVHNKSESPMTIHWHGIFLETKMDGIPGFQAPIEVNSTYKYEFELMQNGTYWYHPHDLNEQDTKGAIIIFAAPKGQLVKNPDGTSQISPGEWVTYPYINPKTNSQINTSYNHDRMIMMTDYMNRAPQKILNLLQNNQNVYMFDSGYSRGFIEQPECKEEYWENFKAMKMFWMDPADVWYDLFFLNDETCLNCGPWKNKLNLVSSETPNQNFQKLNEFSQFTKNDRIRLRLINSSASSYFHVHFANSQEIANPKEKLDMLVVAKDGQAVEPIYADALYMGMGETYDVIIDIPDEKTLYELKIKSIDDYDPKLINGKIERETRRLARVLIGDGSGPESETKVVRAYDQSITLCGAKKEENDPITPINYKDSYRDLKRKTPPTAEPNLSPIADPLAFPPYTGDRVFQSLKLQGNMEDYYWQIYLDNDNPNNTKKMEFNYFNMGRRQVPYIDIASERYNFIQITNTMKEGMMNHPWHLHGLYFKLLTPKESMLSTTEIDKILQKRPLLHSATIDPGEVKVLVFYAAKEYRGAWMFHCHNLYHMESDMMMFVKYDNFDLRELPIPMSDGHNHGGGSNNAGHGHGGKNGGLRSQIIQIQDYLLDHLGIQDGFITPGVTVAGGVNTRDGSPITEVDANLKTRMNCKGGRCFVEIITGVSNQNLSGNKKFYGKVRICPGTKCATIHYSYDTDPSGVKNHTMLAGVQYRPYNSDIFVLNGAVGAICKSDPNGPYTKSDNKCRPAGDFNAALQITNGKIGAFNQLIPQSGAVYRGQLAVGCDGELCSNIYGKVGGEALLNRNVKLIAFCKVGTDKNESHCMAGISIQMEDPIYNFGSSH